MEDSGEGKSPDNPIDEAVWSAQKRGKPSLSEHIDVIESIIAQRRSTAAAWAVEGLTADWDLPAWGRRTYVLESLAMFLQQLASDPEARDYLRKRLRQQ